MNLFYTPDISGDTYVLNEDESKHCVRVLRLKEKETISLVDGLGGFYTVEITDANPKRCEVKVIDSKKDFGKRSFRLHLAIAPTKNMDRMEWLLEKVTEIGVDEISFLECEKSERKVIKTDRLHKIVVSAMKQSIKAYLPKLNEMCGFNEFIKTQKEEQKFIAHCSTIQDRKSLKTILEKGKSIMILIGPEGDFSEKEINFATQNNYASIHLGDSRLRTETAAVVACHTSNLLNEE